MSIEIVELHHGDAENTEEKYLAREGTKTQKMVFVNHQFPCVLSFASPWYFQKWCFQKVSPSKNMTMFSWLSNSFFTRLGEFVNHHSGVNAIVATKTNDAS